MSERKPRSTTVVLFNGDDWDRVHEAQMEFRKIEAARQLHEQGNKRLGDEAPDLVVAAEKYDAFIEECTARGDSIEIRALPRLKYRELLAAHPPRTKTVKDDDGEHEEVDERDEGWGFNYESLGEDLVPASVVDSETYDQAFIDSLTDPEFSKLYTAAVVLNQGAGPDPSIRLASSVAGRTSVETSESPELSD